MPTNMNAFSPGRAGNGAIGAVTDRSKNEGLDGPALLKHHENAPLVVWAWRPGRSLDGTNRTLPPMTHGEFVDATRKWVEAGTPCP